MSKATLPEVVPTLRDIESYREVSDAHHRLESERATLQERRTNLAAQWRAAAEPAHKDEVGQQFLSEFFEGATPPGDREALAEEWRKADRRIFQLGEAIRLHRQDRLLPAQGRAAAEIAEQVRPAYAAKVRELDAAYGALEPLLEELADFSERFRQAGGDARALPLRGAEPVWDGWAGLLRGVRNFHEWTAEKFGR